MKKITIILSGTLLLISACKKETIKEKISEDMQASVVQQLSDNVYLSTYAELELRAAKLKLDIEALKTQTTNANLNICRTDWKAAREVWENSEAWLFGPVATESIDPRIDTWPVDFVRLDSVLQSQAVFSEQYVDDLEESLKGFHPIEYLLYGLNGNKDASELTARELDFLSSLAANLDKLTTELHSSWKKSNGDYISELKNFGSSQEFPTRLSLYEEMANAMIGICDEVANGKINEVFIHLDSMGEESPFAKNSITDFTNNIKGVKNVYLGTFNGVDGRGIEDFVRLHNLSLDASIKQKTELAILALGQITDPFGQAITTQPIQVQAAIDAINSLKTEMETKLIPLIQLHVQ